MKNKIKNYIKRQISIFILLNKQNESNLLVKFIGIIFVILGLSYIFGLLHLSSIAILSFSLSGIIFILSDIAKYMAEKWDSKKALGAKRQNKVRIFTLLQYTCLFLGMFLLIGGPYIYIHIQEDLLDVLGTACAFIAVGLTIMKIGLDNDRKQTDFYQSIAEETILISKEMENDKELLKKENENLKNENKQLKKELDELKSNNK